LLPPNRNWVVKGDIKGDKLCCAVRNTTIVGPSVCLCSTGKIKEHDETPHNNERMRLLLYD
jgi:hypothetical protein